MEGSKLRLGQLSPWSGVFGLYEVVTDAIAPKALPSLGGGNDLFAVRTPPMTAAFLVS